MLAGRDRVRARIRRQLQSGETVHHALYGPRGVGKTVLLSDLGSWAATELGWHVVRHRLAEDQDISLALVDRLADPSRALSRRWDRLVESLRSNLTVGIGGPVAITKQFDMTKVTGPPDTLLERALVRLGNDAAEAGTAVLLLLDEIHTPRGGPELVRLSNALQAVKEDRLPVHGLRPAQTGTTRGATFLERLGATRLGLLSPGDTRLAFLEPWARRGIAVDPAALDRLVVAARGYPYF
ncbi:MAG: AAA family ATPase, partial [Acidimicrobiales bacterium]